MSDGPLAWRSLGHLLRTQAAAFGDRVFLRVQGGATSFREAEEQSNRLAQVFHQQGIAPGERVAVMLPNSADFPIVWFALAKVGAVMVPVNVQYQEDDLRYTLQDSGAVFAVVSAERAAIVQQLQPRCPALRGIGVLSDDNLASPLVDLRRAIERAPDWYDLNHVQPTDVINFQYTSGTSGFPKGCMLTHEYWLRLGQAAAALIRPQDDDVDLTAQPFYYMDPQWNTVLCLLAGIPLVILPRFSASSFWQTVHEHGVTFFYVLGTMPLFLLKQPEDPSVEQNHRLRAVFCSGIVPQLHQQYESRWQVPWHEAYGMTETGIDLAVSLDETKMVGSGAVGRPIPGKQVKIVGPDDQELPDGEVGELIVHGTPMMLGYHNNPEATAQTIRNDWLHTGDLARRDARGYVYLVGRLKDMIRRGGENIAASEVEAVIGEHPAVLAAAVVAVPDTLRGEEVKAFVQLRPEYVEGLDPQRLIDFVKGRLAAFKAPRYISYVDGFPLTPSQRIAKHKLLEEAAARGLPTYDTAQEQWIS